MVTVLQILQLKVTQSELILKGLRTLEKHPINVVLARYTVSLFKVSHIPSLLIFTAAFL